LGIFIPSFGPLISHSLFKELQYNKLPTETIELAYKDYTSKYENKRNQSFYEKHQNDEWFKEKYDIETSNQWKIERNTQCQNLAKRFHESVNKEEFKGLKLELREADENNKNIKVCVYGYNREKEVFEEKARNIVSLKHENNLEMSIAPYFGFDSDRLTLFLHKVPINLPYVKIVEVVKKISGFVSLSLSEPIRNRDYIRDCWVTFDTEENCGNAFKFLNEYKITDDYKVMPLKSKSSNVKRVRITPAYFDERIIEDLELSQSLIVLLDKEKNIEVYLNIILGEFSYRSQGIKKLRISA
jgi:hypothetical protein